MGTLQHTDILYSIDDQGCSSESYQVLLKVHTDLHEILQTNQTNEQMG